MLDKMVMIALCWLMGQMLVETTPPSSDVSDYVYVANVEDLVSFQRGGVEYIGHLDANGDFVPSASYPPRPVGRPGSGPLVRLTNFARKYPSEDVYEYRAGRLIQGSLSWDGTFTPDVSSAVIPVSQYKYKHGARRIYNLPGYFIEKDKLIDKKAK